MPRFLPLNLQYFSQEPSNGGEPTDPPVNNEPTGTEPKGEPTEKTFTQEQLNEAINKRLERERKKFADYDDLKTELETFRTEKDKKDRDEMSEIERLQADLEARDTELNTLRNQFEETRKASENEKIVNAFREEARKANIEYVEDAFALANMSEVKFEDGKVVGVSEVVKSLVESKPFLVKKSTTQKPIGEPTNNPPKDTSKNDEQLLKEAQEKAKKTGRIEDSLAFIKLKRKLRGQ